MKIWAWITVLGAVVVAGTLFLRSDLRGWTPAAWTDPATVVAPIDGNNPAFAIGDCLPGTIDPNQTPHGSDYGYVATMRVLTCRSRSSAMTIMLAYMLVAASCPVCLLILRKCRK